MLKGAKVATLVDVRALANSRRPGFAKGRAVRRAGSRRIGYLHLRALGTPRRVAPRCAPGVRPRCGASSPRTWPATSLRRRSRNLRTVAPATRLPALPRSDPAQCDRRWWRRRWAAGWCICTPDGVQSIRAVRGLRITGLVASPGVVSEATGATTVTGARAAAAWIASRSASISGRTLSSTRTNHARIAFRRDDAFIRMVQRCASMSRKTCRPRERYRTARS